MAAVISARGGFFRRKPAPRRVAKTQVVSRNVLNGVVESYVYNTLAESFREGSGRFYLARSFLRFISQQKTRFASIIGSTVFVANVRGVPLGAFVQSALQGHEGHAIVPMSTACYVVEMMGGNIVRESMMKHDEVADAMGPHLPQGGGEGVMVLETHEFNANEKLCRELSERNGYQIMQGAFGKMPLLRPVWWEFLRHGMPHPLHIAFLGILIAAGLALRIVFSDSVADIASQQIASAQQMAAKLADELKAQNISARVSTGGYALESWLRPDGVYRANGLLSKRMGADGAVDYVGGDPLLTDIKRLRTAAAASGDLLTMDSSAWRIRRPAGDYSKAEARPAAPLDFWRDLSHDLREIGADFRIQTIVNSEVGRKYTLNVSFQRGHEAVYENLSTLLKSAPTKILDMSTQFAHGQEQKTVISFEVIALAPLG